MLTYMSAKKTPRKRDTGSNSHADQKKQGAQKHSLILWYFAICHIRRGAGVLRVNPEIKRAHMFHDKSVPVDLLLGGLYNQDDGFLFGFFLFFLWDPVKISKWQPNKGFGSHLICKLSICVSICIYGYRCLYICMYRGLNGPERVRHV